MAGMRGKRPIGALAIGCAAVFAAGLVGALVHDDGDDTIGVIAADDEEATTSTTDLPTVTTQRPTTTSTSTTTTAAPTTTTAVPTTTTAPPPPPPTPATLPPTTALPPPPPPPTGSQVLLVNDYGSPIDVQINAQRWRVETGQRLPVTVADVPNGDGMSVARADQPGCGDGDGGQDAFASGHRYEVRFYPGAGICGDVPAPDYDLPPREV